MAGLEFLDMDDARRDALEVLLARMLEAPSASPFDALKPGCPPQEIRRTLEAIALPQRIALATRATAKEREYLRQDTNGAVLEALVRNPGLTVAEARLIATSTHLIARARRTGRSGAPRSNRTGGASGSARRVGRMAVST